MKISYIWFDMGYTLVYTERETTYQKALEKLGFDRSLEEIERAFHLLDKKFMRDYQGVLGGKEGTFLPWYLGALNYELGVNIDISKIQSTWIDLQEDNAKGWIGYEFIHDALQDLRDSGFKLGMISNWDQTARDVIRNNGIHKYLDHIVISSEVGFEKPDPRIFEAAFELAGVKPKECLYIGDNYYDDGVGSKKVGMDFLIINRFGRLGIEELKDCTIIKDISEIKETILSR